MFLLDYPQGSQEWLEFRRCGIGASDAPVLMGVGYKDDSPYRLWREKMFGESKEINPSMLRGKSFEPMIRALAEQKAGISFIADTMYQSVDKLWQFASLDGINHEERVILECKYTSKINHDLAREDKVPEKYYPQIQHQLACLPEKYSYCIYASYHEKCEDNLILVKVPRDASYIKKLITTEEAFYRDHMLTGIAPPEPKEKKAK